MGVAQSVCFSRNVETATTWGSFSGPPPTASASGMEKSTGLSGRHDPDRFDPPKSATARTDQPLLTAGFVG